MAVSPADVRRMAALARIGVPEAHLATLAAELDGILAHLDVLSRVQPAPPAHEVAGMPLGPDVPPGVSLAFPRESFAPRCRDGFFLVPRLDAHDDAAGSA